MIGRLRADVAGVPLIDVRRYYRSGEDATRLPGELWRQFGEMMATTPFRFPVTVVVTMSFGPEEGGQ